MTRSHRNITPSFLGCAMYCAVLRYVDRLHRFTLVRSGHSHYAPHTVLAHTYVVTHSASPSTPSPFRFPPPLPPRRPWLPVQPNDPQSTYVFVSSTTLDALIKSQKQPGTVILKKLRPRKRNNAYDLPDQTDRLATPRVAVQPPSKPWSKDSLKQSRMLVTMWDIANGLVSRLT